MKAISKTEEITLLNQLVEGNGYFEQAFGTDLPLMIQNIKNDLYITNGTASENRIQNLHVKIREAEEASIENLQQAHQAERLRVDGLYELMIIEASRTSNDNLYIKVVEEIGLKAVIKMKHVNFIELSREEVDYLISNI